MAPRAWATCSSPLATANRTSNTGAQGEVAEQDVTGAILKITSDKIKTVCFVTGHGEKSLSDSSQEGYSGTRMPA